MKITEKQLQLRMNTMHIINKIKGIYCVTEKNACILFYKMAKQKHQQKNCGFNLHSPIKFYNNYKKFKQTLDLETF